MTPDRATRHATRLKVTALTALAIAALGWVGWVIGRHDRLPPRAIVMATGPEGGAYAELGARYREILARKGLEVRLRATEGDRENLALLREPRSGASVTFLQSGMTTAEASPDLASLGAVSLQPIWVFRRVAGTGNGVAFQWLKGKRLAAGGEASGTRAATLRLLALAGVDPRSLELVPLSPAAAADALLRGEIDGAALVASWDAPAVRRLVAAPAVELVGFLRADAFVALDPSLDKMVLPMGVGDMALNRPPHDVTLLALKVSLVVREDLHPAIQYLLLEAASEIHSGPGIFRKAGQFPAAEGLDLPLSDDARHFYKSGRPLLQRYLPYWVAVLVERLLLVLLPIVGVLVPLVRLVPVVYSNVMQRRIIRLYGELKLLEADLESRDPGMGTGDLTERLDALELRARHVHVPLRYSQMLYTLKQHIEMVRARLGVTPGRAIGSAGPTPVG